MNNRPSHLQILWHGGIQQSKPCGGVARYCCQMIRSLCEKPDLRILTVCPKGAPAFPVTSPALRQISLHSSAWLNDFRMRRVHPTHYQAGYYEQAPVAVPIRIQTVYDFIDRRFPAFQSNKKGFVEHQKSMIEQAHGIIAISESTRRDVLVFTKQKPENIVVAPPSPAPTFIRGIPDAGEQRALREKLTGGKSFLLWVGPRTGYKNFSVVLKAFCGVAKEMDLHLVLAANNPSRLNSTEEAMVITSRVTDRIHILQNITDEHLRLLYASAETLVQSSLCEGFGIPLIECLASGGSLLVSDIPVFKEIVSKQARFADPWDVASWEHAMRMLMQDERTESMRLRVKKEIEQRFDPSDSADAVLRLYKMLQA